MADETGAPNGASGRNERERTAAAGDPAREAGDTASRESESGAIGFSIRQILRDHPLALGLGAAAALGGAVLLYVKVRRFLPFRVYRAVRRGKLSELLPRRTE
jgi:hypothetical protein